MADKKDLFKEKHPSKMFLTPKGDDTTDSQGPAVNIAQMLERQPIEYKSRNVHILIKPSLYKKLDKIAKSHDLRFNGLINIILEEFVKQSGVD